MLIQILENFGAGVWVLFFIVLFQKYQDQDQDSLLVKRRNDNHSPGPVIRELVPSSQQMRSENRGGHSNP